MIKEWNIENKDVNSAIESYGKQQFISPHRIVSVGKGYQVHYSYSQWASHLPNGTAVMTTTNISLTHTMTKENREQFEELTAIARAQVQALLLESCRVWTDKESKMWAQFNWRREDAPNLVIIYETLRHRILSNQEIKHVAMSMRKIYGKFLDKVFELLIDEPSNKL